MPLVTEDIAPVARQGGCKQNPSETNGSFRKTLGSCIKARERKKRTAAKTWEQKPNGPSLRN